MSVTAVAVKGDQPVQGSNGSSIRIAFQLNGKPVSLEVPPWESALEVIRGLGFTGTKEGCGIGECGACTIIVDRKAVNSCLMAAPQLDGRDVETIEGLGNEESLDLLQEAFLAHGAVQCGFCTPGILMSAKALLDSNPHPDRDEIVQALSGNLCRCTGYQQIIDAIEEVAGKGQAGGER
jgi:carbon-monoxide dehydrogenase small subunit